LWHARRHGRHAPKWGRGGRNRGIMTILGISRIMTYDENGRQIVKEYIMSDSPEFFCHTGLHAWYNEYDASRCCKDGWTQELWRGIPILVSQAAVDKAVAEKKDRAINKLFGVKS
jgi:hypothetical protein